MVLNRSVINGLSNFIKMEQVYRGMINQKYINYSKLGQLRDVLVSNSYQIFLGESMTAGFISTIFSQLENASKFFLGAIVCYDSDLKVNLLGVPPSLIQQFSAESEEVTTSVLRGLANLQKADIYISVTGLCAPGGSESDEKPIGTVYLSLNILGQEYAFYRYFKAKSASEIIIGTLNWLIDVLLSRLSSEVS